MGPKSKRLGAGLARLYKVLDEHLQSQLHDAEVAALRDAIDKVVHVLLAGCEWHGAPLVPSGRCRMLALEKPVSRGVAFEQMRVDGTEIVVAQCGVAHHENLLRHEGGQSQHSVHLVVGEHPVTVGKFGEILRDAHLVDEVDVALLGNVEHAVLHLKGAVLQ